MHIFLEIGKPISFLFVNFARLMLEFSRNICYRVKRIILTVRAPHVRCLVVHLNNQFLSETTYHTEGFFGSPFLSSHLNSISIHFSKLIAPTKMYTKSQVQQFTSGISTESVQHDRKNSHFYVTLGDHKAFVEYNLVGNVMKLNHTVVPEIFGGKGVGKILAEVCR